MSMQYIRDTYGVPAKRGMRVEYAKEGHQPWQGMITSAHGAYLRIRRDGDARAYPAEFHPEWDLTYLGGVGNAENTRREAVQP